MKFKLIGALLVSAVVAVSCDNKDTDYDHSIVVKNMSALRQTLYADETACLSINFTTYRDWTSTAYESGTGDETTVPDWVSYTPKSGDNAGDYTVGITLLPNNTGKVRNAVIVISCEDVWIDVRIEQDSANRDGTLPELLIERLRSDLDQLYAGLVSAYNTVDNSYSTLASRSSGLQSSTSTIYNLWRSAYELIDGCNSFLEIMDMQGMMSVSKREAYEAYAHYYRSMSYFYLATMFGGVPLTITTEDTASTLPRSSLNDVKDRIRDGIEYAVAYLPADNKAIATFSNALFALQNQRISEAASMFSEIIASGAIALRDTNNDGRIDSADGSDNITAVQLYLLGAEANAKAGSMTYAMSYVNMLCEAFGQPHALNPASTAGETMAAIGNLFSGWNTGLKFINTARWEDLTAWDYRAFLPIPQQAMDTNSLLSQNPGW